MCTGRKQESSSSGTTTVTTVNANPVRAKPPKASGDTKESTLDTPGTPSNPLTIGTKKYRNNSGLGPSGLAIGGSPSGIPLAK